jgi:cytosine/adenosine deaminase-related metal-dependent hydrolase
MDLLLKNLRWHNDKKVITGDIRIKNQLISEVSHNLTPQKRDHVIDFSNHFLYPGLINAHDHLEMNLYPKLGHPPYDDYIEWSGDIYKPKLSPIKEIQKVNIQDRLLWGGLKNLISGVTTVAHHNPWHRILSKNEFPVKVLKKFAWAHSLAVEQNIKKCFPQINNIPFIIHAAEGISENAFKEIQTLANLDMIQKNTVLVHAVALSDTDIVTIDRAQASVVWCPASNFFMFNRTAEIRKLMPRVSVALGSDSTLTGSPTLLDEMRFAQQTNLVSTLEIYQMVTTVPSKIFGLPPPNISPGSQADLIIAPIVHTDYFQNLFLTTSDKLSLVLVDGKPRYADDMLSREFRLDKHFIKVQGALKGIDIDLKPIRKKFEKIVGQSILELNPLWNYFECV